MERILAENVKRLCKEQGKQLKDLAASMGVDPASLTRTMYGNARLDTVEKIAAALGVSIQSLFEQADDEKVEGLFKSFIDQHPDREELPTGVQELYKLIQAYEEGLRIA